MKIHLDTDIGGDLDDVCALALLLSMREVEITGVTIETIGLSLLADDGCVHVCRS
jgi:inosine-uridine nucleoside N-ribohydrolase